MLRKTTGVTGSCDFKMLGRQSEAGHKMELLPQKLELTCFMQISRLKNQTVLQTAVLNIVLETIRLDHYSEGQLC